MSWPCFRQGQAMVLKGEGLHLERRWKEASIEVVQQQRGPSFMSDRCQPRLGDTLTSEIIPDRLGFTNSGQEPTYLTSHSSGNTPNRSRPPPPRDRRRRKPCGTRIVAVGRTDAVQTLRPAQTRDWSTRSRNLGCRRRFCDPRTHDRSDLGGAAETSRRPRRLPQSPHQATTRASAFHACV